jgi:RNA polymerase sigma factor (sigma-70 family)
MMDDDVTQWIRGLARNDEYAAQQVYERYFEQLVSLARKKLGDLPRRASDEEDIVVSAFHSFFRGLRAGRFPRLDDRDDLWRLLVTITARKAVAELRRAYARKRGGAAVRGESVFVDEQRTRHGIGQVLGRAPTPDFAVQVTEECDQLLSRLEDDSLRAIALLKLEGYTNEEIGQEMGCALGTVARKLARIRKIWAQENEP